MKPFTAWLAMDAATYQPKRFASTNGYVFVVTEKRPTLRFTDHKQILIVADTPENRKKLGMEERS